jgi:SAM-dependent methyltransferase
VVWHAPRVPFHDILRRNRVECPVCGHRDRDFAAYNGRPDAMCRNCGSMERHRLCWLWLSRGGVLDSGLRAIAHFAPDRGIAARLKALPGVRYRTADLAAGRADEQVDVTNIPWPEGSIDLLICSHVLEHVPDDRLAMRELCRVLSPTGYALLEVPVIADTTREEPTLTDPAERLRLFGQADHVRVYGPDYYDRLRESGFVVEHHDVRKLVTDDERVRFGLVTHVDFADPDDASLWEVVACRRQLRADVAVAGDDVLGRRELG